MRSLAVFIQLRQSRRFLMTRRLRYGGRVIFQYSNVLCFPNAYGIYQIYQILVDLITAYFEDTDDITTVENVP